MCADHVINDNYIKKFAARSKIFNRKAIHAGILIIAKYRWLFWGVVKSVRLVVEEGKKEV